jgi:uncharacterized protein YcbX
LKSGKGLKTEKVFCTNQGVKEVEKEGVKIELRDRSFLIYTSKDKEVRTARQLPRSGLIEIQAASNGVILSAPNKNDLYISVPKVKNDVKVAFGNEPFSCTDCGESAAKWLSTFLLEKDEGLRLGYGDGNVSRNVVKIHKKLADYYSNLDNNITGIFSDLAALHLVNQATVDDLNEKLPDDEKLSFLNFRPNLLIEGPMAFAEDNWKYIKVGEVIAKVGLECPRCIQSTVNQNGVMNKQREPLKTLEGYRKSTGPMSTAVMGILLKVIQTGKMSVGDIIYVSRDD